MRKVICDKCGAVESEDKQINGALRFEGTRSIGFVSIGMGFYKHHEYEHAMLYDLCNSCKIALLEDFIAAFECAMRSKSI